MHLKSHEKEIIKKIASGEITDIPSYIKAFNLSSFRQFNKDEIENKFKLEENGKTYKCLKEGVKIMRVNTTYSTGLMGVPSSPNFSITPIIPKEEDFENVPARLTYNGSSYTVEINDSKKYTYDYFKGINVTNSFSDIKTFLTIWQFLKSEGLILEVDKEVSAQDYEPFFEFKPINETIYGKERKENSTIITLPSNLKPIESNNLPPFQYTEDGAFKDFRKYVDNYFEYNKANELICSQFINKQIYGNSELDVFIKKRFQTNDQINLTKALIPAYLALVLALGIAIWQKASDDNSDIIQIQNQLKLIQETLDKEETPDLSQIENELQTIIDNSISSSEIEKKFDEILIELKNMNFIVSK